MVAEAEAGAEAEAAAAATADLGTKFQLGKSPATPDIARNPGRPSGATGGDGSCCTALFSSAAPALAGPGKVESYCFTPVPSAVEEQSQCVPEDSGEVDCAVSTQESSTLPAQAGESSGKVAQQQQEEGVAIATDPGAAAPVPTPEKVEPSPWRRWKKSTKGVPRFKVVKDKVMKVKVTQEFSPVKGKKKKMQEDGSGHMGDGSSNITRRKLDVDSSESKTFFSRAKLMANLKCLAKSRGLRDDPTARMRIKRGKKRKLMAVKHQESGPLAILPYQGKPTHALSSALVPLVGSTQLDTVHPRKHGNKLQAKVLGLDEKTLRSYENLIKWDSSDSESFEGFDIGSGSQWDEGRRVYEQCADVFIATMYDLLGPRKFSQWEGSVIDSVVGTFLTQNVSDNLSSNAFMNLAAKFPPSKRCHKAEGCSNAAPLVDGVDEKLKLNEASDTVDSPDSVFNKHADSEKEVDCDMEVKGHYGKEYNRIIENFISSLRQKGISSLDSDLMNLAKDKYGNPICSKGTLKKFIATQQPENTSSKWGELQEEAYQKGYSNKSQTIIDAVDWESVLHAPTLAVAKCIAGRGQHYIMALRIQLNNCVFNVEQCDSRSSKGAQEGSQLTYNSGRLGIRETPEWLCFQWRNTKCFHAAADYW